MGKPDQKLDFPFLVRVIIETEPVFEFWCKLYLHRDYWAKNSISPSKVQKKKNMNILNKREKPVWFSFPQRGFNRED